MYKQFLALHEKERCVGLMDDEDVCTSNNALWYWYMVIHSSMMAYLFINLNFQFYVSMCLCAVHRRNVDNSNSSYSLILYIYISLSLLIIDVRAFFCVCHFCCVLLYSSSKVVPTHFTVHAPRHRRIAKRLQFEYIFEITQKQRCSYTGIHNDAAVGLMRIECAIPKWMGDSVCVSEWT